MATAEGVGWRHLQGEHEEVQKRWKHVSGDTSCKKKQTLKTVLTVSSGVKDQLRVGLNVGSSIHETTGKTDGKGNGKKK